jgi:uncharacterized protein YjbJ (UPF0337 family)
MSEMNPGRTDKQHAGTMGARRAVVGEPTDNESINVPPTRPGAAENAHEAERAREGHETFVPEAPQRDDRTDAVRSRAVEEESLQGGEPRHGERPGPDGETPRHRPDGERRHGGQDAEDVRQDIRQTRQELGETVHALAHKADVKSRAGEAAETAKGRAGQMAGTAKGKAAEMTETARGKAAEMTGTAKEKAAEMTGTAKEKAAEVAGTAKGKAAEVAGTVKGRAAVMADKVHDATPEQARKRPVLMIAAMGAVLAFAVRRIMRRNRAR